MLIRCWRRCSAPFWGVLIGPITTVYYDSGFLVSLKGFVGAIIGGLVSYPLAAAGALLVGLTRVVRVVLGERVQGSASCSR